ncbi:MAG: hypothetical protein MZV49_00595 [Rhodopseudomonas palustris]|nr:hypothetical protein [Rhodopseudomonas palustris]
MRTGSACRDEYDSLPHGGRLAHADHRPRTHGPASPRTAGQVVIDWLAAGLDPARSSHLRPVAREGARGAEPAVSACWSHVPRLQRNPTVKEQARDLGLEETMVFGHLGYPGAPGRRTSSSTRRTRVPVGEDQVPHVEITREIARRFNALYGNRVPRARGPADAVRPPARPGRRRR